MMATAPPPDRIEDAPEEPILGTAHWLSKFTKEERREILALDDRKAIATLVVNWGITFAAFALVGLSEGLWLVVTIPLALALIGGRQLGCSIVMHEASHRTFLRDRVWNDRIGNWLGGLSSLVRRAALSPLPPRPSREDRHRAGPGPVAHQALPAHEGELRAQGVARPLGSDGLEADRPDVEPRHGLDRSANPAQTRGWPTASARTSAGTRSRPCSSRTP